MSVYLTKYQIRQIYLAKKLGIKSLTIKSIDKNVEIKLSKEYIIINENKYNLKDLFMFLHKDIVLWLKDNEIIELYFQTRDGRIYRLVTNGDLDYFNIDISGQKIFSKKVPIKNLIDTVISKVKGKTILVVGSKGGYYTSALYNLNKKILTIEEDEYLIELSKYNPYVSDFFKTKYKIARLYYLKQIPAKSFDTIIYNPKPFNNPNRFYYSVVVFRELARIAKRRIIVDLEPPTASNFSRVSQNIILKFRKFKFDGEFDKEFGLLVLDRV